MICTKGHEIKVIDGPCRECARERQAEQRNRNAEGRRLAQALRERGIPPDADQIATLIAQREIEQSPPTWCEDD